MNRKRIAITLTVAIILAAIIFGWHYSENHVITKKEKASVTSLVENFASKTKDVSLSSPNDVIVSEIKNAYSPFVSKSLLTDWEQDPSKAIGRLTSSPWPEKIEINSIRKTNKYEIDVKGNIIYVASENGELVETGKAPIELVIRKDPQTGELQIDRVRHGEYTSIYDKYKKDLLPVLKNAFPDMKFIGENGNPYISETVDLTGDGVPEAIVDMGCGGASIEYYTVCYIRNGTLKVVNFKDKNGKISHMFFDEGSSIKHTSELKFLNDGKGNTVLYSAETVKNDSGEVTDITVNAYKWNKTENLFEYNEEFSKEIKKTLEKQLMPKPVFVSYLNFKEIKTEFPLVGSVFPYGGEVVLSCGEGKLVPNSPGSANINHIVVYNVKADKVEYSREISKKWMRIDKVRMNNNWILFKAISDKAGEHTICFAINRKTGKMRNLLENYGNFRVNDILLQGDYAAVIPEKTENGSKTTKFIRINLNNGKEDKYLENTDRDFTAFRLWKLKNDCAALSVSEIKNGDAKQYIYLYSFTGRSSDIVSLPEYINVYVIPPDEDTNRIIYFHKNGHIVIAPLRKPDNFEEIGLNVFDPSILVSDTVASKDYIVAKLNNGDIFVFNRKTKERSVIKGINAEGEISLNGDILAIVKHPENASDSVIFIDLKENKF